MTNWSKLPKAYKLIYRTPLFWWQYFMTRPFPSHIGSLEDLIQAARKYRVMGFNGQCIRAYIIWRLFQYFHCTSFIETGTRHGHTAGYVRRVFKTPVHSCELSFTNYLISKLNLAWASRLSVSCSNSPDFLKDILRRPVIGDSPMFYLDAHVSDEAPLPDELSIIANGCERGVVVIDDFFVPSDPRFHYDEYPNLRIDVSVIDNTLKARREDATVYLPAYDPAKEGGPGGVARGMAAVLLGQSRMLPADTFPFDLLFSV